MDEKITKEMKVWFDKRTKNHIQLVDKYYRKLQSLDFTQGCLSPRIVWHDKSKFEFPNYEPYVFITWDYHMKALGKELGVSDKMKEEMNNATVNHIMSEPHHPEFWDYLFDPKKSFNRNNRDEIPDKLVDATTMRNVFIEEMVCDWCAMSEEKNTNPFDWADKNVNKRWKFTEEQATYIYKLLEALWKK